jgi:hypothetical protein
VPGEWLADAVLEVVDHFGAASYETQKVEGHWRHGGVAYRDNLVRIVVDVPDSDVNRDWMKEFKRRWKAKLEQLELWVVSYRIEIEQRLAGVGLILGHCLSRPLNCPTHPSGTARPAARPC